jgi:hypothetical protein
MIFQVLIFLRQMIAIRSIQKWPHIANIGRFSIVESRFISRTKMSKNLLYRARAMAVAKMTSQSWDTNHKSIEERSDPLSIPFMACKSN